MLPTPQWNRMDIETYLEKCTARTVLDSDIFPFLNMPHGLTTKYYLRIMINIL